MSQFMFNPTGAGFGNTMDPLSNLDALERRKREMAQAQAEFDAARARARAKREAEEAARRPASVEAPASAPTAPAAAAPAAKPNASTSASAAEPDKYSLLRKAAQDRYQAELSRMADISTSGGVVPPLSSKRAGQRYENELNRLAAIQAMERDRAARREALVSRVNERKAAQAARRAQIAAMRQRQADEASQAGIAEARDIIQASQSVNLAALQERQFLDRLMEGALAPRTPATNQFRAALAQTPTGRLMDLAKPTDAVPHPYSQEINDLRDPVFGRPDPGVGYMGEYREDPLNPRTLQTREAYDVADPAFGAPLYGGPYRPSPTTPELADLSPAELSAIDPVFQNPFFPGPTGRSPSRAVSKADMTLSDLAALDPVYGDPQRVGPDLSLPPRLDRSDLERMDPAFGNPLKPGTPNTMAELPAMTDTQYEQMDQGSVKGSQKPSVPTDTQMEMVPGQLRSKVSQLTDEQAAELSRLATSAGAPTATEQIRRQLAETRRPSRMVEPLDPRKAVTRGVENRMIVDRSIAANQAAEAERQRRLAELARYPEVVRLLNELAGPGGLR